MAGLNALWMCRVAAQRDLWHAFEILCLSPCLGDCGCGTKKWEMEYLYVYMCVFLLWIWHSYGKRHLWVSPFKPSLITIPTGKAAQRSLSNANSLSLLAHNRHRLAISHSPFTVYFPCIRLPGPNTLTHTHNVLVWLSPRETRQWTVNLLINTRIN